MFKTAFTLIGAAILAFGLATGAPPSPVAPGVSPAGSAAAQGPLDS